jgi:hypothetical protein
VAERGFIWGRLRGRGARVLNRIGESRGDLARNGVVFVTDSREGMTSGAHVSVTEREERVTVRGKR